MSINNYAFRSSFLYGGTINWFPGHMIKAARLLKENLKNIDVILELRDSRAPISSENPILRDLLKESNAIKTHVVVFNKSDLANHNMQKRLKDYIERHGDVHAAFTQSSSKTNSAATQHPSHPRHPLQVVKSAIEWHNARKPPTKIVKEINMMVIGVPNVGKSSLINAIRKGTGMTSAAKTGALPGVTRHITGFRVSENPPAFLVDTPGIMIPGVQLDHERALTLSLIGAISEKIVPNEVVADFLLYKMNAMRNFSYVKVLEYDGEPTDDIDGLLKFICKKKGLLLKGTQSTTQANDFEQASRYFISLFRDGKFGSMTLDKIPTPSDLAAAAALATEQQASTPTNQTPLLPPVSEPSI
eukprot:gene2257-2557_t